jgi:hypothetical protein
MPSFIKAEPELGEQIERITMTDPRWPAAEGWVKMQYYLERDGINIHYAYNTIAKIADDFRSKMALHNNDEVMKNESTVY